MSQSQIRETSLTAYRSFERSGDKIDHHRKILSALEIFGEGTSQQISDMCGLSYSAVARRISELIAEGKVIDTGRKGKSPSGRGAIIWKLSPEYIQSLKEVA
jgi:predicted ArsR family transcriptional regulator